MANMVPQGREGHFHPTSPHSSSGAADSFKGTPDTRITTFSPDDGSAKSSRQYQPLNLANREAGPIRFSTASPRSLQLPSSFLRGNLHLEKDPFVSFTESTAKLGQKLSPTASVFAPVPSDKSRGLSSTAGTIGGRTGETNLSQSVVNYPQEGLGVHPLLSTEANISRCLAIYALGATSLRTTEVEFYFQELTSKGNNWRGSKQMYQGGDKVFVRFENVRDSCIVFTNLTVIHGNSRPWIAEYVSAREFSQIHEPGGGLITAHEGQIYLNVFATQTLVTPDTQHLEIVLKNLLQTEGDLFAFKAQAGGGAAGCLISAIAEFSDNDTSLRVCSRINNFVLDGSFQVCAQLYRPEITPFPQRINQPSLLSPARIPAATQDWIGDFGRMSVSRTPSIASTPARSSNFRMQPASGMVPVVYHNMPLSPMSPMSPSHVFDQIPNRYFSASLPSTHFPLMNPMLTPSHDLSPRAPYQQFPRRQNATRVPRTPHGYAGSYQQSNNHNVVEINRIREGTDVRTTIMLRNIPNKVDQAMLKGIIDESSWGKYDFMYLRIDFANDCNVGYAFINFVDPLDIVDFVNARGNQRWNCFKSDKVAEISYATIQGKDCLVQKFRNSSVMLEAPHYRPKLYFTLNGPRPEHAGEEETFPGPDNQSKMKRSCENAEHVGLFTPNAGQHYRDEQRRRRSQYDRGTRLAEMEEYDYEAMHRTYYSPQ
ncbi:RNA recognition motif 2-domain-containing protein [Xylariaceae sp. FL0016]|nr:RNA recognition motif 2-domain-containing protein [Xylariaceae sp. FL0016]